MKCLGLLMLALSLMSVGCLPLPVREPTKSPTAVTPPPAPPAVLADDVNEKNAINQARALKEELQRESQRSISEPGSMSPNER